jgi:hypothetical protein
MLEIILLIYLARRIRGVVEPKGYKPGKWQAYAVILWIVVEIFAILLFAGLLGSDTITAVISAYLCAIGASIALQKYAENLPNLNKGTEDWIDNLGNDQYNQ